MIAWMGTVKRTPATAANRLASGSALLLCAIALLPALGCGGETPTTPATPSPGAPTGTPHFGVDGFSQAHLQTISELHDGASGINGVYWGNIEPDPPVGGQHRYADPQQVVAAANRNRALGRRLQVNLRPDNDWALETGSMTQVDPGTGARTPSWVRIKPEYVDDWADAVRFVVGALSIDYLQIGSEAENSWESPQGFAEAVTVAATAAKAVKPDIKILAAGFNFGNSFLTGAADTPKRAWVREFLSETNSFDILTLHLSHIPTAFEPTAAWVQGEMAGRGYNRPVWVDDMASGPFYQAPFSSPEELALQDLVEAGDPAAVAEYAVQQARFAIKKPVHAFAAGVERVFLSTDTDWPDYFLPIWRHQGLVRVDDVRKAAFYSYQQLITEVDGFVRVERAGQTTFKFSFADKAPVVVVWTEGEAGSVDLSGVLQGGMVRVKTPVTRLDSSLQPIRTPDALVSAGTVPVSTTPVFVTLAN
jgi:hypothetical protein